MRDAIGDNIFQMAFPSVPALVGGQTIQHGLIRRLLQIDIERGIDLQAAFVHLVGAVFIFQISPDLLDEIRSERVRIVLQMQNQRRERASAAWAAVIFPSSSMALMTRLRRLIARSG